MSDGNIVAARTQLDRVVQRLISPRPGMLQRTQPSLYNCLVDDLAGTQGETKTPAKSLPPVWIDALQLLADIDAQTHKWMPVPGTTPRRLVMLTVKSWRPQDTNHVTDMAAQVEKWCDSISHLLDPEAVKHISAACPQCGRTVVYRKDSAGETVRQPALRLVLPEGCTCQACKAHWPPEQYMFLCKLLGFEQPEGVVG